MDATSSRRVGLLDDYMSEDELAAELDVHRRTVQRWRQLRIGPPFVMNGIMPIYNIGKARQWLAAGGTASKRQTAARGSTHKRKSARS
jgi:Homeodomain-like domain